MSTLQQRIIDELGVRPEIDPAGEVERRVRFLADYLAATPARGYVLGISGGQDSTLAGRLAQMAIERRRAAGQTDAVFVAARLPYGEQFDESDARLALGFIGADRTVTVDIRPATDVLCGDVAAALADPPSPGGAVARNPTGGAAGASADAGRGSGGHDGASAADGASTVALRDFVRGNVKARARMVVQYAIAGQLNLLVIGTDHAAEAVTGFYTKFGDGAADVTPLSGLTKRQGAALLAHLGASEGTWRKVPTADLEDDRPALPDEEALGVSYQHIDDYLQGKSVPERAAERIERWYSVTRHKRAHPVAPGDDWWRHAP